MCHLALVAQHRSPFSLSYRGILPSSFNTILSSALVFSTCLPVSVSGTVLMMELFPGTTKLQAQSNKNLQSLSFVTSIRLRNVYRIPIDYGFRPHLRGRLTLRGITLRRNPWIFGDSVSRTINRYSCQNSHFRYLHQTSQSNFNGLRNAPLPHSKRVSTVSVYGLSPVTSSVRKDLFRPVSCYAFFKGMAASKPTSWLYWTFYSLSHLTITWGP